MNGIEVTDALHRHDPELPVILITAYPEDFSPESLNDVHKVLTKPIDTAVFFDTLLSIEAKKSEKKQFKNSIDS